MQEKSGLCFEHVERNNGEKRNNGTDVEKLVSCLSMSKQLNGQPKSSVRAGGKSPPLIQGLLGMVLYPVT